MFAASITVVVLPYPFVEPGYSCILEPFVLDI